MSKKTKKMLISLSLVITVALISMQFSLKADGGRLLPETGDGLIPFDILLLGLILSAFAFVLGLKYRRDEKLKRY